jgi:putative DNA primase/helicase
MPELEEIEIDEVDLDGEEEERIGDFVVNAGGVYFLHEVKEEIEHIHVCAPLKIEAVSRNKDGKDWGKLLVFSDLSGTVKTYHLRMSLLTSKASQVATDLVHEGLTIGAHGRSRTLLIQYLHAIRSTNHVLSSTQPGWVENNFLLPEESFGSDRVVLSSDAKTHNFRKAGTLKEWKANVASLCPGNSRLLFGASVGFAAPVLRLVGIEGGGFHVCGDSSTGKSTTLQIASSIYGSAEEGNRERYLINWDTTKGALELAAESLNDCLFACDELGLVDGAVLGQSLYMLGGGTGKARMVGEGKRAWRIMIFTSGEVSIAEHMAAAGAKTKMGQEVRLLQIAADAGKGMGLFENIHGSSSPAEFSNHIKRMTGTYYGEPLRVWLKCLVDEREAIAKEAKAIIERFKSAVLPGTVGAVAPRAALRFGVVAAAGEIATRLGLTGWKAGQAFEAAETCFASWKEHLKTFDPTAMAVERVRHYVVANESEFVDPAGNADSTVGYLKKSNFLIHPEIFRDVVCTGVEYQEVATQLEKAGFLLTSGSNRQQKNERIRGKLQYYYVVKASIKAAA